MSNALPTASAGVMIYGIADQNRGVEVLAFKDGHLNPIAKANALRPSSAKNDWTRSLFALRPLLVSGGDLFYYLPKSNPSNLQCGIYKKSLQTNVGAELILKTTDLIAFSKGVGKDDFWVVSLNGNLMKVTLENPSINKTDISGISFASFNSSENVLVTVGQSGDYINLLGFSSEKLRPERRVTLGKGIKRVFTLADVEKYAVEKGWSIGVYDKVGDSIVRLVDRGVTASAYDSETKTLFFFVANDNDGRSLYSWRITDKKPRRLVSGIFNDALMP
jgi:hypothetical protein